jgi:hypothetical protein
MDYRVEFRHEEGWGAFSSVRFGTEDEAIRFAMRAITPRPNRTLIAARVWLRGRTSEMGDRVVWDSRD